MPTFLLNFLFSAIFRAIAWLLTPPPDPPESGTWDDVGFKQTEDGSDAGLVFGHIWRANTSIYQHWAGDFTTRPIRQRQGKK